MTWLNVTATVVSWLFYASALAALAFSLGFVAFFRIEAFRLFAGHLRIAFGITLFCGGAGLLVSSIGPFEPFMFAIGVVFCGVGFAMWLLGRQRAREVNRFLRAAENAKTKLEAQGKL